MGGAAGCCPKERFLQPKIGPQQCIVPHQKLGNQILTDITRAIAVAGLIPCLDDTDFHAARGNYSAARPDERRGPNGDIGQRLA